MWIFVHSIPKNICCKQLKCFTFTFYLLHIHADLCPIRPTLLTVFCQFHQTCLFSYFMENVNVVNRTEQPDVTWIDVFVFVFATFGFATISKRVTSRGGVSVLRMGDVIGGGFPPRRQKRQRRASRWSWEPESCALSGLRRTGARRHLPGMSELQRRGTGGRSLPAAGWEISARRPKWPAASLQASPLEAW